MSTALQTTVQLPQQDIDTPFEVPAGKPTPEMALALAERAEQVRAAAQGFKAYAMDLHRRNVRALGRDEVFVVRDGQTQLRCVKTAVRLTVEGGHLYEVQGKWRITADGYTELNKIAGVSLVQPETIIIGGKEHENPYLETHPLQPGVLLRVHCRVISVGRSKTGEPIVVDYRLRWEPNLYMAQTLRKAGEKWIDDPSGRKNKRGEIARIKVPDPDAIADVLKSEFDADKAEGKLRGWGFLPISAIGDDFVGVAFNTRNPGVAEKLGGHVDMITFGERRAQTIARRNALRHSPAIGVTTVLVTPTSTDGDRVAAGYSDVEVYGWPPSSNRSLREVADLVAHGTAGTAPALTVAAERVETVEVSEDADPADDPDVEDAETVDRTATEPPAGQGGLFEGGESK